MTSTTPTVGTAFPAKVVRVSGTTLFHVAAKELGDALQWSRIAALNGLVDPWIGPVTELKIPSPGPGNGGVPLG